ncbi:MAG: twin-arginine translocase subunit TatC [Deltaproteobacteria bacterium]|nr:twin-arginine translocase subunit TatC [Deltaproteobacteria bacterium]
MEDAKLTLYEHLSELRGRLWKVTLVVLALGGASLAWSREIFNLLMRPVLAALPEGNRALVYTSGIEEINVLLKVGLYAGLFLATPVALHQLWKFVAPGLLKSERRAVGPFVAFGTVFFVAGALFCYWAILPSMFRFLLTPGEAGPVRERITLSRARAEDAGRLFFAGEPAGAAAMAREAVGELSGKGEGQIAPPPVLTTSPLEMGERAARLGRLLDLALGQPSAERSSLALAVKLHAEAEKLLSQGSLQQAAVNLEESLAALAQSFPDDAGSLREIWSAQRHLAAAQFRLGQEEWTKPMLSMKEQLSLVLMLEVAFGAIFELPLIMALLAMIGLLKFRFVAKYQRYAILACVVLAAIVSPTGDVVNLSLMAVPMVVCFEVGVLLVWVFERRRNERAAAAAADGEAGGTSAAG